MVKPKTPGCDKKPYQKPTLRMYGDIRTMTQSTGKASSKADGGPKGHPKTA